MPDTPPTSPARLVVITDLPCIHCGYNLRTGDLASLCPECGRPIADSLDSLALANPSDLSRVLTGLRLMFIAATAFPLVFASMMLLSTLAGARIWTGYVAGSAVCVAGPILSLIGVRLFGARIRRFDASRPAPPESQWHGAVWPALVGVGYGLFVVSGFACMIANELGAMTFAGSQLIPMGCCGLAAILWLVRSALVCRQCRWLALHAGSPSLARTLTWFVRFAIACALGGVVVGGAAYAIAFAEELFHFTVFDRGLTGRRSPPVIVILGIAFFYVAFFGWLALNPIALALLYLPISRCRRIAIARAGGPVFQTSEPPPALS